MTPVNLQVCKCCAMSENYVAEAVARIRERHGAAVEVTEVKCLDVCQETAAAKLGDRVFLVTPDNVHELEDSVRQAVAGGK